MNHRGGKGSGKENYTAKPVNAIVGALARF